MRTLFSAIFLSLLAFSGCKGGYSFTGGDTGEAKTLEVVFFPNYAPLNNPNCSQVFTDAVRDVFLSRTNLEQVNGNADLKLDGAIINYTNRPLGAQSNERAAQNRFTIEVRISYTNELDPEKDFEQKFSRYRDYSTDFTLEQVENQLMIEICDELAQDIFNRALVNW